MDEADLIWNRACDPTATLSGSGDRALQAVILVHSLVMNSGLYNAMYSMRFSELASAADGFLFFGRTDVAEVLRDALQQVFPDGPIEDDERRERHVDEFDERAPERLSRLETSYHRLVPDDEVLEAAFRERLSATREEFAALD
jgi:Domain of unknown function (DUF4375)